MRRNNEYPVSTYERQPKGKWKQRWRPRLMQRMRQLMYSKRECTKLAISPFTVTASKAKNAKASRGRGKTVKASLPVDVFIVTPTTKGTYPVLLFCHGWKMTNEWYSDLFDHIASHGYIIVAPQFYGILWEISISEEIKRANAVTEWLPTGILAALVENDYDDVYPDVENNLVVTGHSRGGKIAFALALGETGDKTRHKKKTSPQTVRDPPPQKFKAVIGVDPVAGTSPQNRVEPKILQYIPRCFNMSIPVAVVGGGLSNQSKTLGFPACAPDGVNHSEFFNESKPPVCYFLAREYGHFDMLNDNSFVGILRKLIAVSGKDSTFHLMRSATGGTVVAFLRAYVSDVDDDLEAIVGDPSIAPVLLDPVLHVKDQE